MGLKLLLAARKSRKGTGDETDYRRQDHQVREWAEREGHVIVKSVADTVSSQTAPWRRRDLGPWMTDPRLMAMYDAILISDTDRISRGTDKDFHYIEHWCYENGKSIVVAKRAGRRVFYFPARDGNDIDKDRWDDSKESARDEWEAIRDRHADTREVIRAQQEATGGREGIIGMPPFGYRIEGTKLHKTFVPDEVTAPLAVEAFERIARGATAISVARWLTAECSKLGLLRVKAEKDSEGNVVSREEIPWRVKRVRDMIKRRTYLGERDGARFEALVSEELFNAANAALEARSFTHKEKGGKTVHAFSGAIYCPCGAVMYHHQSERGKAKYTCSRGRVGNVTEAKCGSPALDYEAVNDAVNAFMARDPMPEYVMKVTGGDAGKKLALEDIKAQITKANAEGDMDLLVTLAAKRKELEATPEEPIEVRWVETGRLMSDVWREGDLEARRALLKERAQLLKLEVSQEGEGVSVSPKGFYSRMWPRQEAAA